MFCYMMFAVYISLFLTLLFQDITKCFDCLRDVKSVVSWCMMLRDVNNSGYIVYMMFGEYVPVQKS